MKTDHIIDLISRIRNKTNRFISDEFKKIGLSDLGPSYGAILNILFTHHQINMKEITKKIDRDKSTTTSLIQKLEKLAYVKREINPLDNRITLISITDKGKKLKSDFDNISERLIKNTYKDMKPTEIDSVISGLEKILNNWE